MSGSYRTADLQRISDIWKRIGVLEAEIRDTEKRIEQTADVYAIYELQGQVLDKKCTIMRLERELAEYRPEDVERGKKIA